MIPMTGYGIVTHRRYGRCFASLARTSAVVVVSFLVWMVPVISPAAEMRVLTLEDALAIAGEKNRDIQKAYEYGNSVRGTYVEERSAAFPQLALNGSATLGKDESQQAFYGKAPQQYSRNVDLTLSQPLYTWGKVSAAIRAAEVGLKTADEQLRLARQAARRDVSVAFYDILLAKELHRLAVQNHEQKGRHRDEAHRKLAAGVATDYDVLAADVAVENARPEVIRSENRIRVARERLRFLLAIDDGEVDVAGTLESRISPPPAYADALKSARERRPELADIRHRIGIYEELVTIADADNKPRLDLKGGAGWHHLDVDGTRDDGAAWDIGVYLTFPFFDGLKTSGRVQQARSDLATRQIEEKKLVDEISLEVRNAVNSVREAAEIVAALGGTVRQAERLLQMAEKGYEYGVKIRLEVEDAQLNLLQAQSNLARARRDYLSAQVDMDWTMGRLGE